MRRISALALAFVVLGSPLAALEAKEGLVKIVVNEQSARLSLYQLVDIARGRYEALFFDQDPRTSFASLSVDGKVLRLGDAAEFRQSFSRTETGVRIEFRSASLVVSQDVDFAKSREAALADGVKLTWRVENVSQRDALVGLRVLVDTYLGERSGVHLRSDKAERISEERFSGAGYAEKWISSPGDKIDFMIDLDGSGGDRPESFLVGNWKRLSDESWSYQPPAGRNFTQLPYSVNDSAVAFYWQPANLARGASRSFRLTMGAFSAKGYASESAPTSAADALFNQTVLAAPQGDKTQAVSADLVAVRDLIGRIDRSLASGKAPSAEELAAWRTILDRLEERAKGY